MSEREYKPEPNPERYKLFNTPNVFRDDRMYVEVESPDLARKGICKYLTDSTPSHMVPIGKKKDTPIVVIFGDTTSMDDETLTRAQDFYLDGVLRAASTSESIIIDSGLVSAIGVCKPKLEHSDFCRNTFQMGILPGNVEETLSLYHTQIISVTDFDGWNDQPAEFAKEKINFIRRLAGRGKIICILFNEGHVAFEEAYAATQAGLPVIAVQGSGPLADELAEAKISGTSSDSKVTEMINSSCLTSFDMSGRICDFAALIRLYSTVDMVSMQRQISKLSFLDIEPVWFERGKPLLQLRVREGVDGRLKFYNNGKTARKNKKKPTRPSGDKKKLVASPTDKRKKRPSNEKINSSKAKLPPADHYDDHHHEAATKIAALHRGNAERKDINALKKKREEAAILIQKTQRGRQGAKRFERKKQGKPLDVEFEKEKKFKKVDLDFDPPIISKYRKDGFWVEILHVANAEDEKKLYIRVRLHGIGQWLDLPKKCVLKQGKAQKQMKIFGIRQITKKKAVHDETNEGKLVIVAVCVYIIKPTEEKLENLNFTFQAGYQSVAIPNKFLRSFDMFQSAGPLKKPKTASRKKKENVDGMPEGTPEEIAAAIKMEAIARGKLYDDLCLFVFFLKEEIITNFTFFFSFFSFISFFCFF
jgi:hypothetical protein